MKHIKKKSMLCLHICLCTTHMVSLHVDAGNPGPLKEQVLLITEPTLFYF